MKAEDIYITSDSHYFHENIIQYCNRPFSSVEEMDEVMILSWNKTVPENGIVFHLGDVSIDSSNSRMRKIREKKLNEILPRLHGEKHLILGNHDEQLKDFYKTHFKTVKRYQELDLFGDKYVLFHYPIESWNGKYKGSYHLHGHTHGNSVKMKGRLDVGVDNNKNFSPFSLKEVKILLDPQ